MTVKIAHLTSVHQYNDTRIFIKECSYLADTGYKTYLIAPNAPNEIVNGVHLKRIEQNNDTNPNRISRMTKTTKAMYNRALEIDADIYHFHDPELIPIGLKLKKKGKKVIYDVHEDVPRQILSKHWIPKALRSLIAWTFEKYENYAVRKFDGVVTATPFINNRFSSLGCKAVNVNNYPILSELHTSNVNWNTKERAVCYVGGITKIRGIVEMVKALEHTTDILLFLGGKFTPAELQEEITKMDGWQRINYLGFLNRAQVAVTFSKSMGGLVVLHPTINYIDALPVKMFEYMAAGIPVIASSFPLLKKIVEGNNCGICVDPLNQREIAKAIQWLVDNPDKAEEMGKNGKRAVEEKYNWEKESEKLLALYKELETN